MPLHSSYKIKIALIAVLSLLLALEITVNFDSMFHTEVSKPSNTSANTMAQFDQFDKTIAYTEFANVIDDNIFVVDEIIQVTEVKKPVTQSRPFTMQLEITGIVITPERKLVMVWDKQKQQAHVLQQDETLDQWTVDSIDKNRVSLTSETNGSFEFILNKEDFTGLQE